MNHVPQHLTLPVPPSANRYWRKTKRGNVYVSEEAKAYRATVADIARSAQIRQLYGPVAVKVKVFRARHSGDLMNKEKVLSDALQGFAFVDDSQIVEAHFFLSDDAKNPRVEFTFWEPY